MCMLGIREGTDAYFLGAYQFLTCKLRVRIKAKACGKEVKNCDKVPETAKNFKTR
jgi:hypothetical protein